MITAKEQRPLILELKIDVSQLDFNDKYSFGAIAEKIDRAMREKITGDIDKALDDDSRYESLIRLAKEKVIREFEEKLGLTAE